MTGILDRLPAPARHFVLIFVGSALTVIAGAITSARGVTGLDWPTVLLDALNAGIVAGVAGVGLATVTPFMAQYGIGASPSQPTDGAQDVMPGS